MELLLPNVRLQNCNLYLAEISLRNSLAGAWGWGREEQTKPAVGKLFV